MMANRSVEWTEDIAKKLKKKSYRQQFFLSLIEDESLSLRDAIQIVAKSMGNKEFSSLIDMAPSNTSRIVNPVNDIKATTLEHVLEKLGCQLSVKVA
jgi:DNA-binding Xre family transcriptional regulator